ncbi:hypothetical protein GHT06_013076 [Daphnia sinensis]|uniref:Uncharacterized protein n=1 Tax=Daphnia sinensis TaxID=1820382 RepID=A0AAD5Q0C0_9CRUS|nr:hypothetical protein GHT06_013076 [Daphnia sinensis]
MRNAMVAMRMEKLYKLRLKVIRLVIYTHVNKLTRLNIWFVMFAEKVGQESQQRQKNKQKRNEKQNTNTMENTNRNGLFFFLLSVEEILNV